MESKKTERLLRCDECKGDFTLSKKSDFIYRLIKIDDVKGEFWLTYFLCPHCQKMYPIILDNKDSRNKSIKYDYKNRILYNSLNKDTTALKKEIIKLQKEISIIRRALVIKHGKAFYRFAESDITLKMDFTPVKTGLED